MAILIKRYANRKLYNTEASRYITLKGIGELIEAGEEIRVIDNETGEDITSVALSQILVDSERSNSAVPRSLLSQLVERGGDVLYTALKRGVDDATEGLEEFQGRVGEIQNRVRRVVRGSEREGAEDDEGARIGARLSDDIEHAIQNAVERVFKLLDLPRRSDIDALSSNLDRVAEAIENLETAIGQRSASGAPSPSETVEPGADV